MDINDARLAIEYPELHRIDLDGVDVSTTSPIGYFVDRHIPTLQLPPIKQGTHTLTLARDCRSDSKPGANLSAWHVWSPGFRTLGHHGPSSRDSSVRGLDISGSTVLRRSHRRARRRIPIWPCSWTRSSLLCFVSISMWTLSERLWRLRPMDFP